MSEILTPQRLFSDPPLQAPVPMDLQFIPGRNAISYRAQSEDSRERMCLYEYDCESGEHRLLLDAKDIGAATSVTEMTAEERAERERRRQFTFGVNQYTWLPDGEALLLPLDGQIYRCHIDGDNTLQATPLCAPGSRQTGMELSPQGTYVSYVRAGDLYFLSLETGAETRVTDDASDTITNGLPDFLAAEEMHRFEGHWWSEDARYLAFCRVDESPVEVSYRLEIDANGARTVAQRYPYTGATNPDVELWVYDLETATSRRLWRSDDETPYLARIAVGADALYLQIQDRRQQQLRLSRIDLAAPDAAPQALFTETSATWVNLFSAPHILPGGQLLLSDELEGTRRLALLDPSDGAFSPLPGPAHINRLLTVKDATAVVEGWHEDPTENHLFRIALDGSGFTRTTQAQGCHECCVAAERGVYIDKFSNESTPPTITLHAWEPDGPVDQGQEIYRERVDVDHPYYPYLQIHQLPRIDKFTSRDGHDIYYQLTPPSGNLAQPRPLIVYVYGGPGPQRVRRAWGALLLQLFSQSGFGVLMVDNRGSGNRGLAFESPLYRRTGHVEVIDHLDALDALKDVEWFDPQRVGIFGHSYGGYMTLMSMAQHPGRFTAGVAVAPTSDWALYDSHYTERYMGLPGENVEGYQQANVLTHLPDLVDPLLLMHGMADDNVLFTHTTRIMDELQKLHRPFELMTYPGAKHSMQESHVSIHRFEKILAFFQRHLQPG